MSIAIIGGRLSSFHSLIDGRPQTIWRQLWERRPVMPVPFIAFPTLREFIERAKEQGCREGHVSGIVGPRGPAPAHYLVGAGPNGAIKILPNIRDDEHLPPTEIANMVRVLKVTGFDHYFIDDTDLPDYDYRPENPS